MNRNDDLLHRSRAAVWHPCTQMKHHEHLPLVPVARGEGPWLIDMDGRRCLDAVSSWWVNLFGHCHPRINAAVRDQLDSLEHVILAGFTHEPVVQLSERLARLAPGALGHCFYASDGSSAVEIALKMSFHYWRNLGRPRKRRFVSVQGGYHGETLGALSVTDVPLFSDTYRPLLQDVLRAPSPDWRLAPPGESPAAFAARQALALDALLAEHHEELAAVIVEPLVQCAGGMAMHDPDYLRGLRAACERRQVHFIADEIAVGFGRTGSLFACEQAGVAPDFLCLSKGLTGGYLPLSVVLTRDSVYQAFWDDALTRGFLHSHSYTGNPLACRAALAVLDLFAEEDWIERNRATALLVNEAARAIAGHPRVRDFRNTGMIWAFEVDRAGPDFSRRYFAAAMEQGVLLRPLGNTVYFMPPYVVGEAEIAQLVDGALAAIAAV